MSELANLLENLLTERFPDNWRRHDRDGVWSVDATRCRVIVAEGAQHDLRSGALIGTSRHYWALCDYAARVNKHFRRGRIFVEDEAPGVFSLVVQDYYSAELLGSDSAATLVGESLCELIDSIANARDAARDIDGLLLHDQSTADYAMQTLAFL